MPAVKEGGWAVRMLVEPVAGRDIKVGFLVSSLVCVSVLLLFRVLGTFYSVRFQFSIWFSFFCERRWAEGEGSRGVSYFVSVNVVISICAFLLQMRSKGRKRRKKTNAKRARDEEPLRRKTGKEDDNQGAAVQQPSEALPFQTTRLLFMHVSSRYIISDDPYNFYSTACCPSSGI